MTSIRLDVCAAFISARKQRKFDSRPSFQVLVSLIKPLLHSPMAQPEQAPAFSGPGLIYTTSRPFAADLTDDRFNKWYSGVHMADALATGAPQRASRWRCADENEPVPYLALYRVKDLAALQSEEFKKIPMTHESLPAGPSRKHSIFESINFDTRIYKLVEHFEKEKHDESMTARSRTRPDLAFFLLIYLFGISSDCIPQALARISYQPVCSPPRRLRQTIWSGGMLRSTTNKCRSSHRIFDHPGIN